MGDSTEKITRMTENSIHPARELCKEGNDTDKSIYRYRIKASMEHSWNLVYRYSDLFLSSNTDVIKRAMELVRDFYRQIDKVISSNPRFLKSLVPLKAEEDYTAVIKKMCHAAGELNVGPMAAVAGAVCDYIAEGLPDRACRDLIIENGGDLYLRSRRDLSVGLYIKGSSIGDSLSLQIKGNQTPCGLCSSSGRFGHSLSLGKSDLVTVMAVSTITADAAATAIANSIISENDIDKTINIYRGKKGIRGILIVKNERIGIWGNITLSP
ncbi:MAG: UPF0280 family protein [Actinobacteria bacterium]|nr:UPF0280 family protein [Actinomycetota bacterium]